ncbi:hypothetical protein NQ318_018772, partial [Aromia moschata]
MGTDFRKDWVKKKVTKFFGLKSEQYFEEMMATSEELEDKLDSLLDDDFLPQGEGRRFFYVYKTTYEKLVEEQIMVAQKVEKPKEMLGESVEFAKPVKKKGKEKKGGKKKEDKLAAPSSTSDGEAVQHPDASEENITEGTTVEPETKPETPTAESP